MARESLRVAVVGIGGIGSATLQAAQQCQIVKLVGVGDKNPQLAKQAGQQANVPFFSDNRSLLAQARPEAIFLAVPPMNCAELISACAERGIAVWKEAPLGRNLNEAVAMVSLMEKADLPLAVGTQRRFSLGYRQARQLLDQVEKVFLARAHYLFNWGSELGWRGDKSAAGGGALLELGYHPIDLLVWMLGLPEEVYGLIVGGNMPGSAGPQQAIAVPADTDDTAAAVLRFGHGAAASVVTTRSSGPVSEELCLHGLAGSITATSETCTLRDPDGNVLHCTEPESIMLAGFIRQVESFATAVLEHRRQYECSGLENLMTQAVIEALYLSGRTMHPENPAHLLGQHNLSEQGCLLHHPID